MKAVAVQLSLLLVICICCATTTCAQTPESPVITFIQAIPPPQQCAPAEEICGDGVDQDCNGSDLACPPSSDNNVDTDNDGFSSSEDCDDSNREIYPSIAISCSAACGNGTSHCNPNGSYSPCLCTPLCEAVGTGRCFYISSNTGSDSNPGTFTSPWKTYLNIVSSYDGPSRRPQWTQLQAGDVVYFMSGNYRETFQQEGHTYALYLRNIHGNASAPIVLKAYPGHQPRFEPLNPTTAIHVYQSSHVVIDNLDIYRAYQFGITFEEGREHELRNTWIHEVDGVDNHNIAGLHILDVSGFVAHHNLIHDNYDRTNADTGGMKTQNSRDVVIFSGGNIRFHHNTIFQTPAATAMKTGGCITYKHAATIPSAVFEVDHNILRNCSESSIGSGTPNSYIHHNLIIDSSPISLRDFGGRTFLSGNIVEHNTIVGGNGLYYEPTTDWAELGPLTFGKNIVVDTGTYHSERGIITVHTYGSDTLYRKTVTAQTLTFSENCYFNGGRELKWNLFAENGGAFGNLGDTYDYNQWQQLGYDISSSTVNPNLDANYKPQTNACTGFGWKPS